jgi:hypothetical protein
MGSVHNQPLDEAQGYDRLIQVVAGSITAAASALGVLGIGAGVAISLLRNWPAATLTGVSLAAVAVLAGITSAFAKSDAVLGEHRTGSFLALTLGFVLASGNWLLVGRAYTTGAARSSFERTSWWGFVAAWIIGTLALAILAWSSQDKLSVRAVLVVGALVLFGSAILGLVVLAASASRSTARPAIAASVVPLEKPAGFVSLTSTVTAAGLSGDDRYEVVVMLPAQSKSGKTVELFRTFAGPSADGTLDYKFTVAFHGEPGHPLVVVTARLSGGRLATNPPMCSMDQTHTPPPFGSTCVLVTVPLSS